ncbi:beta-propeller fold lactonase family protein [Mycolicibacterium komossense]|uniref:Beta-propeller fold lactonase family protein n=1 Tax=Mycolicibacterium komossense TaxID=1779 RepID=A0ABT3CCR1_9MYCO|nr:beta-propeller fold lactonase family protein [Mycolicibacterium komossense]
MSGLVVATGLGLAAATGHGVAAADTGTSDTAGTSANASRHSGPKTGADHTASSKAKTAAGNNTPTAAKDNGAARSSVAESPVAPNIKPAATISTADVAPVATAGGATGASSPKPKTTSSPAARTTIQTAVASPASTPSTAVVDTAPAAQPSAGPEALVSGLLAALGLGGSPTAPAQSPTLWTVLAWARRQFIGAFYNQAPIAHPVQTSVTADGLVRGTLGAVDPDGDPMTYTVDQQPTAGTVTVGSDGSYTYKPGDPSFTGTDTFTVTVRDQGFRLFSQPGVTVVEVSVRIGEPVVVISAPDSGTPDPATGQVSGSLGVKDPNSPAAGFTYTVLNKPKYGTVTFDSVTGHFTYTPSIIGRISAALTPGLTDSFTVAVGTTVSAAVDVDVTGITVSPRAVSSTVNQVGTDSFPFGMAVSKDGTRAYVTNIHDGTVSVIDLRTGQVGAPITVGGQPTAIAVSPSGNRIYVLDDAGDTVSVINTATGQLVGKPVQVGTDASAIVLSADGNRAYVSNSGDGTVSVIDTAAGKVVSTISVGANPLGLAVSPDGRYLYVANSDTGTVSVINTLRYAVVGTATVGEAPTAITLSADGSRLYVANSGDSTISDDGTVSVIDTKTLTAIGSPIRVGDYPSGLALSADGTQLYVTDALSNEVSVIDTRTFEVADLPVASGPTSVVAVNGANGPVIIVAHADLLGTGTAPITVISLNGQAGTLGSTPAAGADVPDNELSTSPAAAGPPVYTPPRGNDWTLGYDITNLTGYPIVLQSQTYDTRGGGPANGTVLLPGATQHFEVTRYFWTGNGGTLTYYQPETKQTYVVSITVNPLFSDGLSTVTSCQQGNCLNTGNDKTKIGLLAKSGSNVVIPAQQSDDQAAAVNALCDKNGVTCSFKITSKLDTYSAVRQVNSLDTNNTGTNMSRTVSESTTETVTSNWKLSTKVGFKVIALASAEIAAEYGKSSAEAKSFGTSLTYTIRPGYQTRIMVETPITRYYGDMEITVGDTTITLTGTYFDAARAGNARWNVIEEPQPTKPTTAV